MNQRPWLIFLFLTLGGVMRGAEPVMVGRGLEIRDVMLPGAELRARKSRGLTEPLTLRITATYPHGTQGFRYDFHCVPMVAGKYNLTQFLETAEGEPAKGLPPIIVEVAGVLPAGPPGGLKEMPVTVVPKVGGYEALIPYGIGLWAAAGLGAFWYFRKRKAQAQFAALIPAPTLVEQLKTVLQRAVAQPLGTREQAEFERLLLAHGREQLGLAHATDPAVWRALRENPETALWLRTLEAWLHRPVTSPPSSEELRELLAQFP